MSRTMLVAGNWKMHGSLDRATALAAEVVAATAGLRHTEVLVCPTFVHLDAVRPALAESPVALGAQDVCGVNGEGAHTGEISAEMLADVGCRYVIVGHSERRALYGDSDQVVATKFAAAQSVGLVPILCVGETRQERESDRTAEVLQRQLSAVVEHCGVAAFEQAVIAYEPVWAIGTGLTATPEQAQQAHADLRARIADDDAIIAARLRILYGGSVKPDNANALFSGPDVDGGLIGGAALKADQFLDICKAAEALASG